MSMARSLLLKEARRRGRHTPAQWWMMLDYCNHMCLACHAPGDGRLVVLTKDHVVPISQGGSDGIENLQPLCFDCNARKRASNCDDLRPAGWQEWVYQ